MYTVSMVELNHPDNQTRFPFRAKPRARCGVHDITLNENKTTKWSQRIKYKLSQNEPEGMDVVQNNQNTKCVTKTTPKTDTEALHSTIKRQKRK